MWMTVKSDSQNGIICRIVWLTVKSDRIARLTVRVVKWQLRKFIVDYECIMYQLRQYVVYRTHHSELCSIYYLL